MTKIRRLFPFLRLIAVFLFLCILKFYIIKTAGIPIVAPSANLSGSPTGTNIKNIINELNVKVYYILDSGDVSDNTTSTIVEVNNEKVIIIREGKIKKEQIGKIVTLKS